MLLVFIILQNLKNTTCQPCGAASLMRGKTNSKIYDFDSAKVGQNDEKSLQYIFNNDGRADIKHPAMRSSHYKCGYRILTFGLSNYS